MGHRRPAGRRDQQRNHSGRRNGGRSHHAVRGAGAGRFLWNIRGGDADLGDADVDAANPGAADAGPHRDGPHRDGSDGYGSDGDRSWGVGAEGGGSAAAQEEIEKHETYRSEPDLQETAGGGLVVNAFIMDGPVHVEVRDRKSGKLLLEKRAETLFPFEIPRRQLGVQMTQVVVKIYVKGKLAHELTVEPGH